MRDILGFSRPTVSKNGGAEIGQVDVCSLQALVPL